MRSWSHTYDIDFTIAVTCKCVLSNFSNRLQIFFNAMYILKTLTCWMQTSCLKRSRRIFISHAKIGLYIGPQVSLHRSDHASLHPYVASIHVPGCVWHPGPPRYGTLLAVWVTRRRSLSIFDLPEEYPPFAVLLTVLSAPIAGVQGFVLNTLVETYKMLKEWISLNISWIPNI